MGLISSFATGRSRRIMGIAGVAAFYFLAALCGLLVALNNTNASPVWPAAGVGIAALYLGGMRYWPGVFLGALAANFAVFLENQAPLHAWTALVLSSGIALGNTLEAVAGVWLLQRWLRGRHPLASAADVFRFEIIVVGVCCLAALNGSLLVRASGLCSWEMWPTVALTWWLGDVTGILAIAPFAFAWREGVRPKTSARELLETGLAHIAVFCLTGASLFLWGASLLAAHWKYFTLGPLLWVSFRLGRFAALLAYLLFAVVAVSATVAARPTADTIRTLIPLQLFVGFAGVTNLLVAAALAERRKAEHRLQSALAQKAETQAAMALREAELRLVVEGVPSGIIMVDSLGRLTMVNSQAERLFGYSRDELFGQSVEILLPERYRGSHAGLRAGFNAHPRTRPMGQGRDLFGRRKDGSEFPVEIGLNPTTTPEGYVVLATVVDITERKRAELELRESEQRFRVLAETVPSLLFTATPEGAFQYISRRFEEFAGFDARALAGTAWIQIVHQSDASLTQSRWLQSVATGEPFRCEFRLRRADGEYRWVLAEARPLQNASHAVWKWFGAITDIHDQKLLRTRLQELVNERTEALQASVKSMEELLYSIAHDLRAPNRAITGFSELLVLEFSHQLTDTARLYLDNIQNAVRRNNKLISDLLSLGRVANEPISLVPVDTRAAVNEALVGLKPEIARRGARIHLGDQWPKVLAHQVLLTEVVTHLLRNALTFVPPQKPPEIRIWAGAENGHALLRVKDNGPGIPGDQFDKIFTPFIRLPGAETTEGTGIGLAIVKKAVERFQGTVGVESTLGCGSCFWLELRRAPPGSP